MSKNKNELKMGVILSYISKILGIVINLTYTPIMIRLLGQSEYGLYNLVASVVAYLGVLNFGFGSAYMRYYSKYKTQDDQKNISRLNGMFLMIFSVIGIIAVISGLVLTMNVDIIFGNGLSNNELSKSKLMMFILVINMAISFPSIIFNTYITANERFKFQYILQIVKQVLNPFVVLPILLLGYGSIGLVIMTTLLNISVELVSLFYCFRNLGIKFSFDKFDKGLMKEMTVFSSYIFINMVVDQINWNVDKLIIGRYLGTSSVAIYSIAVQLNSYYQQISSTISAVFIPRIHRIVAKSSDNSELTELFTKIGRIQFIILTLIMSGFIFLGKQFIFFWAGDGYITSFYIALLLMLPVTIPLIQNIGIEVQRAKNMHQFRSWVYLLMALGNIAISIPFTQIYGEVGAAIGTAITLVLGNGLAMNYHYHVKVGLDMKYFWSQILKFIPSLILPIVFGVIINIGFNLNNPIIFITCGVMYVVIFGVSVWFFGLNDYEKNLLLNRRNK